jgi:hypothetical protein
VRSTRINAVTSFKNPLPTLVHLKEPIDALCKRDTGYCAEVQCDAGARFCDEELPMQCSASGASFTSIQVCPEISYCDAEQGGCSGEQRVPDSATCNGRPTFE